MGRLRVTRHVAIFGAVIGLAMAATVWVATPRFHPATSGPSQPWTITAIDKASRGPSNVAYGPY
ncbi:MAG: hypothetical protein ABJA62_03455, partial [Luteimonas sp.]